MGELPKVMIFAYICFLAMGMISCSDIRGNIKFLYGFCFGTGLFLFSLFYLLLIYMLANLFI